MDAIPKRIERSPRLTHSCEIAETIPHPAATGESAGNSDSGIRWSSGKRFSFNQVRQVLGSVLDLDLHAKRIDSLCDATLGVLHSASLAVCTIGQGLAAARGLNPKHATKQVDRLLSNPNINVDDILARWVPYIIGARNSIVVALDWTDFDADKQATIMLSLITDHSLRSCHTSGVADRR